MRKLRIVLICVFCLIIGGVLGTLGTTRVAVQGLVSPQKVDRQPVVFVPGSGGTNDRFDQLFKTVNQHYRQHSILKVEVMTDGQIKTKGQIVWRDKVPLIVVSFENNNDGDENVFKQTEWFEKAMQHLTKQYHFKKFNGVGYSNGGLVLTRYAERYPKEAQLGRLLTIGTPYNGLNASIKDESPMLADLKAQKEQLSKKMVVYSVGGTTTGGDDGIVPAASVAAGREVFQNQIAHYMSMFVSGNDAKHTSLPENETIVYLIEELIVQQPVDPQKPLSAKLK